MQLDLSYRNTTVCLSELQNDRHTGGAANGYKCTELGIIPHDWHVQTVGQAFDICNHLRLPISQEIRGTITGKYPYYGPTKVQGYINEYRADGEYALIGEDGDHFLKWRELPMTLLVAGKFNVNNHAHVVRGTANLTKWFYYSFYHKELTPYLTRQGVGRYKLTKAALVKIPIALPSVAEQARIAEILDAADATFRTTETVIEAKTRHKRAFAEQLLAGGMRFPEFNGQTRQQYRLGELFTERTEMNRPDLKLLSVTGTGGIVERNSLVKRDTSSEDKSKYLRVAPGDIAYNTMRMWQGVFGLSDVEGIVSPAYTVCTPNERIDGRFAAYLFKLPETISKFHRHSQGLVSDTLNCKFPSFAKIKVTVPAMAEQRKMAEVIGLIDQEIALLRRKLDALKQQQQGLMQKLLTGQVRVKEFAP